MEPSALFRPLLALLPLLSLASAWPGTSDAGGSGRPHPELSQRIRQGVDRLIRQALRDGAPADRQAVLRALHPDEEAALSLADDARKYLIYQGRQSSAASSAGDRRQQSKAVSSKDLACTGCIAAFDASKAALRVGVPSTVIANTLEGLCSLAMDAAVCSGAIHNYMPEVLHFVETAEDLDGALFCALALGGQCGRWEDLYNWEADDLPLSSSSVEFVPPTPPVAGSNTTKVLHLTDIHLDLSYTVGTDTECGLPLCCSNTTQMAEDPFKAAGPWGSFYCDLPRWTFEDMLAHIKEYHDSIDYIMLTGDYPAHDVWSQSRAANLEHSRTVIELVKKYFPDTPVIPNMGNHESFPCNSFPPVKVKDPEFDVAWLLEGLSDLYGSWLPEEARAQFRQEGRFTYLFKPGFRIISINSNMHIGYNFWLSLDYKDPSGDLAWLYNTLLAAEGAGEKVHIVAHAPLGSSHVVTGFAKNYAKVVDRFANTITAQFFGHTHNDEFLVFYDAATNTVPVNVGLVSPSVTTHTGLNPSYKVYTLDGHYEGASMRVMDGEAYVFDLLEANQGKDGDRPRYYKLYDYRNDLEMENLFPADFDLVARRMATDDDYYKKFFRFYNSDSWGDDDHSRRLVVCTMVSPCRVDERKCNELMGPPTE